MNELWNRETEQRFFIKAIEEFASPEQLFYITKNSAYLA